MESSGNENPLDLIGDARTSLVGFGCYILLKSEVLRGNESSDFARLLSNALRDPRYQDLAVRYSHESSLPEPFGLELDYLNDRSSLLSKFLFHGVATAAERSLWTANKLLERGKSAVGTRHTSSARVRLEIDYLCGASHVPQIAYFLEYPDYSFDHLDAYLEERK
ncbi:hypothetical protein COV18_04525 [Candidatus Woesearchaeota archaeon CG10_big_fil_rev_8_21_14_0_10_37_12]|nr:MAG: hypothetical protein COV18_04525 [Candidatus Woesearchaeota archaeon CG10_big_fil_rev_8_21_14_0_10_37_12]